MNTDYNSTLILLSILIPFVGAIIVALTPRDSRDMLNLVATLGFAAPAGIAIWLFYHYNVTDTYGYAFVSSYDLGLSSLGISLKLGLNGIGLPLYLLAGIVGAAAGVYAIQSKAEQMKVYLCLLLVMQSGLMGVFSSIDIFFFYFFHEFALIPTFIMIGVWGGRGSRTAAIEMAIYLTVGALISLVGLIALYLNSGLEEKSFDFIALREILKEQPLSDILQRNIFGFLMFGFGILVSLFPFHSWAPKSYAAAPTSAAMLHAGVLKKFGLYGLIQIALPLLPSGAFHWSETLAWLALGNIIIIGMVTIAQTDLKQMIGYSSVMHMGYAFLGIVTFSEIGVGGAIIMMFGHGLSVSLLLMLSTCVYHRSETLEMKQMGGMAGKTPVLAAFFVAGTMAGIGLPGFANFWGEFTIFVSLWESPKTKCLLVVAAFGILISAIYGLRAVANVFFGKPSEDLEKHFEENTPEDMTFSERVPACILVVALLVFGIFPSLIGDPINRNLDVPECVEQVKSCCSSSTLTVE